VADKPEFIDMIIEATTQKRRRAMPRVIDPDAVSRLNRWPLDPVAPPQAPIL
jgi:hypothetical protein